MCRTSNVKDLPARSRTNSIVESVNPASHLRSLLQEQVLIAREFAPLLQRAGLVNGRAAMSPIRPSYYWRLFEADHHATLSLGAMYFLQVGDHYQMLDIEYYVSGTYYTTATLYEIWPIRDGVRTGSLVWCDVLCSAPILRFATGDGTTRLRRHHDPGIQENDPLPSGQYQNPIIGACANTKKAEQRYDDLPALRPAVVFQKPAKGIDMKNGCVPVLVLVPLLVGLLATPSPGFS